MAEQIPDQPDPDAPEDTGSGTDEAPSADSAPEDDATSPSAEGANLADSDATGDPAATPDAAAVEDEIDDMASAALAAARNAIGELQGEAEHASTEDEGTDPALVEDMMAKLEEEARAAEAEEAAGRTIGKASARGGTPEDMDLPALSAGTNGHQPEGIELLADVDLQVKIELGRTVMLVEDVLRLNSGSIVELDKLAGDPVDVFVNDRRVARGEVLVLNDAFCVRISEVLAPVKETGKP
jgi:flagellar motor switch protein FliN